jgi:hypothetical protein
VAEAAIAALRGPFAVLDRHLAAGGFVVGGRFTVADINLAEVVRYAMPAPELFDDAPALRRWLTACHDRPAFRRMMAERETDAGMARAERRHLLPPRQMVAAEPVRERDRRPLARHLVVDRAVAALEPADRAARHPPHGRRAVPRQ